MVLQNHRTTLLLHKNNKIKKSVLSRRADFIIIIYWKTNIKPFFSYGREHPAMYRSGQCLFSPPRITCNPEWATSAFLKKLGGRWRKPRWLKFHFICWKIKMDLYTNIFRGNIAITRKLDGILEYILRKGGDYSVIFICAVDCSYFSVHFIYFILLHCQ